MEINRRLLPVKGHFFLYWGFMASAPPFVMVVVRQMGVPLNVQGIVSGVVIAAAVFARPLIGAFVDTFPSRRKAIFLVLICLMIASYNPLGYLPPLQPPPRLSGSLLPPPHGLVTPLLAVPHQHQRHRDECVVTSAWDCFAFPLSSTQEEGEESLSDNPDTEVRFSLRLVEEGRHKGFEEGENSHEESKSGSGISEKHIEEKNELGHLKNNFGVETRLGEGGNELREDGNKLEGENKLRDKENEFEEDQNSHTGDRKGTVSHEEVREQVMAVRSARERWGLDANETLVYVVDGSSDWRFTNVYNVSVRCLGGELGTLDADGASQEGSCEPGVLKEAGFWVYVLCLLVSYITSTTVESFSDAICCDSIGEDGDYGRQRAWGILSFGLLGVLSGLLVDWCSGESTVRDYRAAFLLMTACGTLDLLLSAACLKIPKLKLERKGVWTNLSSLLRRPHFLVFIITVLLTGFFDGLDTGFLFVLQEDIAEAEGSNHVNAAQGFTMLVQAITAFPFMFVGDSLVRRFSAEKVMNAVLFLYSMRLLSLSAASYFGVLWCTVVVEVINGPCYGLGYTAIVIHAAALSPRGLSTTVQSVVGVCYGTLGYAGASFVGGVLYELVGGQRLYLLTGLVTFFTWTLHLAYLKLCPPNFKATKFKMAEAEQQEEPEVLQVMVGRDGDTTEATQRGGTEGELLKKRVDVVEREKDEEGKGKEEDTDGKGKDKREIGENGKEKKQEFVKPENETADQVVDKQVLIMDKKASEKTDDEEKNEDDGEKEIDILLKNAVPIRRKERGDIEGGGGGS